MTSRPTLALRLLPVAWLAATAGACRDKTAGGDPQVTVAAVEGMNAVPGATDIVLGVEVAPLARSALVERAITRMLLADPGLQAELDKLFNGCGFDPARDLSTVLLAMDYPPASGGAERALLVATGRISEGKLAACVGRHMSELGGSLVQKTVDGRPHYHADAPEGRSDVWFAFGSPETLVVSSSPEFLGDALGSGPRLAHDSHMASLVHRAKAAGAAVWAAGRVTPEVGRGLAAATGGGVAAPRAMFGHFAAETGLQAELGVELASPEEAKSALSLAKSQLRVLAQIAQKWKLGRAVAKVTMEAADSTLFLRLTLSDDELRQVLAPIDSDAGPDQNPAPPEGDQGVDPNGQGDAAPGGEAPLRKQGKPD